MTSRAFGLLWSNGRGGAEKPEERDRDAAPETKADPKASVRFDAAE
jgi:hypothetical protein